MKNKWIEKAKNDLYKIASNLSYNDWMRVNINPRTKKKYKKHRPYSLSIEAQKAQKLYTKILEIEYNYFNNILPSLEDEEEIKGYLLPIRLHRTELLR